MNYDACGRILDGVGPVRQLDMAPGGLMLIRGRNSMHRVTPTQGKTTRSARMTFYGRLG